MAPSGAADDYLREILDLDSQPLPPADVATTLEQRAEQSAPGSEARSAFLSSAGDRWVYAGDDTRAEAAFRAAIEDGGDLGRYADSALVLLLLQAGRDAEADDVLATLRDLARADQLPTLTYEMVGEALEDVGRLKESLRWFTMPLRRRDLEDLEDDDRPLLEARARVRRALGLAKDRFDLELDEMAGP